MSPALLVDCVLTHEHHPARVEVVDHLVINAVFPHLGKIHHEYPGIDVAPSSVVRQDGFFHPGNIVVTKVDVPQLRYVIQHHRVAVYRQDSVLLRKQLRKYRTNQTDVCPVATVIRTLRVEYGRDEFADIDNIDIWVQLIWELVVFDEQIYLVYIGVHEERFVRCHHVVIDFTTSKICRYFHHFTSWTIWFNQSCSVRCSSLNPLLYASIRAIVATCAIWSTVQAWYSALYFM